MQGCHTVALRAVHIHGLLDQTAHGVLIILHRSIGDPRVVYCRDDPCCHAEDTDQEDGKNRKAWGDRPAVRRPRSGVPIGPVGGPDAKKMNDSHIDSSPVLSPNVSAWMPNLC